MTALRAIAFSAFAAFVFVAVTAPAGSSTIGTGCGPSIDIRDPGLRDTFAKFDASQSLSAAKVCAFYRNGDFR